MAKAKDDERTKSCDSQICVRAILSGDVGSSILFWAAYHGTSLERREAITHWGYIYIVPGTPGSWLSTGLARWKLMGYSGETGSCSLGHRELGHESQTAIRTWDESGLDSRLHYPDSKMLLPGRGRAQRIRANRNSAPKLQSNILAWLVCGPGEERSLGSSSPKPPEQSSDYIRLPAKREKWPIDESSSGLDRGPRLAQVLCRIRYYLISRYRAPNTIGPLEK
ncbi:hypothetical protein F5X96DRAFT_450152 [Biscogniauxia mediterranea]|nr:hypothetical protein F5X96DRAFT_450152 [Biscogniauxia mediterranea]